jgi:hypothetical protein
MTTSYTDYRGRGFWANDTVIELWLHLLTHTIPTKPHPAWIARACDDWAIQASVGFLGCVDVGLDRHLAGDPTREAQFLTLIHDVDEHLTALGPAIPAATATSYRIGGRTEFLVDVDVRILHRFSASMISLGSARTTEPPPDCFYRRNGPDE